MTNFSRTTPSPRYLELLAQFQQMHAEPAGRQPKSEPGSAGDQLPRHAVSIKLLIDKYKARSLLDYGSGNGLQYGPLNLQLPDGTRYASIPAYWGIDQVDCYDPAHEPHVELPAGTHDGVLCTDVLELCPEDDLRWIVGELFAHARLFVFANVACYPPTIRFDEAQGARCTARDHQWWQALVEEVAAEHPAVRYHFTLNEQVRGAGGRMQQSFRPLVG